MVQHVSRVTGWNWYMWSRCAYLLALSSSTCGVAPGSAAAVRQCDWHSDYTRYFPCSREPSGCFPFARCNLEGSSQEGILQLWGHVGWYCWDVIVSPGWIDSLNCVSSLLLLYFNVCQICRDVFKCASNLPSLEIKDFAFWLQTRDKVMDRQAEQQRANWVSSLYTLSWGDCNLAPQQHWLSRVGWVGIRQ